MTFRHSRNFPIAHRDRIMAKRDLYRTYAKTERPFDLIEFFSTADRRRAWLPHQGNKECARRLRSLSA